MQSVITRSRPAEAVQPVRFWPDHFFTQAKKKKMFLVGFDQCFTAWQRKSSKYSNFFKFFNFYNSLCKEQGLHKIARRANTSM